MKIGDEDNIGDGDNMGDEKIGDEKIVDEKIGDGDGWINSNCEKALNVFGAKRETGNGINNGIMETEMEKEGK